MKPILNIEVYAHASVEKRSKNNVAVAVTEYCRAHDMLILNDKIIDSTYFPKPIEFIRICCDDQNYESLKQIGDGMPFEELEAKYHIAVLEDGTSVEEMLSNGDEMDGATTASNTSLLPCRELDGAWESLFFVGNTKQRLLRYAMTSLLLAKKGVDPNVVLCNRLILLHGPPGTGKTTIAKSLGQKLSIRLSQVYAHTQLVEVNCHSLFSKWFSESGKLVSKMFSMIRQYALDPEVLVIVLIDEVESLTSARQAAISSSEPSDAIRVVNAVLTQLDALRFQPNVLVLATSNLTEAIDSAFTDRADMIQYVGPPGPREICLILRSCFLELERAQIFEAGSLSSKDLSTLMLECQGLSGRTIRKLPIVAFAEHPEDVSCADLFFDLLTQALHRLVNDRKVFK